MKNEHPMKALMMLFGLWLSALSGWAYAAKTDVVILHNGDRITGEVKSLEAGLLEFKTDTMGTVNIEWRFISEIISDKSQSIEIKDGTRILGTLQKPAGGDHVLVNTKAGPVDLQPLDIVSVWPVEEDFVNRMELDLSFGLDYAKATETTNLNAAVDFSLRSDDRRTEASFRSNVTRHDDIENQNRYELKGNHEYLLSRQRFRNWFGSMESNDALGVDLRLSAGGAFGKYLLKSNRKWLTVSAGLVATQENPNEESSEANLEAMGNVRYRYFRYAEPERSLDSTLSVYPSLTDSGRVRADFRTTFKLEVIRDLFWSLELYGTHDNQPLAQDVDKTDYGFITAIGWSY
jgi:hypothetical protein